MDVPATIAEARQALESGHDGKASKLLERAVYETWDLAELTEIRDIVSAEQAKKGHELKFGNWHDVAAEVNARVAKVERDLAKAPV